MSNGVNFTHIIILWTVVCSMSLMKTFCDNNKGWEYKDKCQYVPFNTNITLRTCGQCWKGHNRNQVCLRSRKTKTTPNQPQSIDGVDRDYKIHRQHQDDINSNYDTDVVQIISNNKEHSVNVVINGNGDRQQQQHGDQQKQRVEQQHLYKNTDNQQQQQQQLQEQQSQPVVEQLPQERILNAEETRNIEENNSKQSEVDTNSIQNSNNDNNENIDTRNNQDDYQVNEQADDPEHNNNYVDDNNNVKTTNTQDIQEQNVIHRKSATVKPAKDSNIPDFTVVTALFDLGRGRWDNFRRPLELYLNYSRQVLALEIPIVAYVQPHIAPRIWEMRKGKEHLTDVVATELEDLPFYKEYFDQVSLIMSSETFRENNKVLGHPEGFSPEYNILMNAKFAMMHEVAHRNKFGSSFLYWLDIGYAHGHKVYPEDHRWIPRNIMTGPNSDKITYIIVNDITLVKDIHQLYKKPVGPAVNGGFFGGSLHAMDRYYHLFNSVWEWCLTEGIMDDDQTLAVASWLREKELFNMVPGGWYDVFELFK